MKKFIFWGGGLGGGEEKGGGGEKGGRRIFLKMLVEGDSKVEARHRDALMLSVGM